MHQVTCFITHKSVKAKSFRNKVLKLNELLKISSKLHNDFVLNKYYYGMTIIEISSCEMQYVRLISVVSILVQTIYILSNLNSILYEVSYLFF